MIKLLIADDHPLMANGIKSLFVDEEEIEVVTTVSNGIEVIEVLKTIHIDVLLLDLDMPEMNGIDCAKVVVKDFPKVKIAILTMHEEKSLIKNLVEIGVSAYMLKTIPKKELLNAIDIIYNGGQYFNADITNVLLNEKEKSNQKQDPLIDTLTKRESEIIKLIAQGNTNSQIGDQLYISPKTADVHRTNIMRKLDVHNVAGLVRFAFKNGLIEE
jgi:DNA-binding NarL/FixJ family response regulator